MSIPPISPAPAETSSAAARGRTSYEGVSASTSGGGPLTPRSARSRQASLNVAPSDYSDRDSFRSHASDSDPSDESDELDLDPEDIPVTGFAVASNKRNQDFHELFPTVPEGDYLIEDYGCALQREILIQGRLYISENHLCFHANIFGWITDLTIPMYEVISLEKRMTAFVIPNAIQLSTRTAKYTFTSFLSRDTTFDVLFNVWRLARPEDSSDMGIGSQRVSLDEGEDGAVVVTADGAASRAAKVTRCDCAKTGQQHYTETAMDAVFPGTPDKIYNLMFTSGFMKDFMRENQKLLDIQISDWTPTEDPQLLARNMTYIKPLNASIGPKQTRCELRDETIAINFDSFVTMLTTTRTPEVPSGNVFSVKTKTCITWASDVASRVLVTTQVEWTGRSFIKGIIERSCIDGQKTYHVDLEKAMREYIHEHRAEFVPEGVDVAAVEESVAAVVALEPPPGTPTRAQSDEEVRKERERERNRRGLQWAYDTFEGALKVARQSTEGALELVSDAWDQSSSTTILYFVIVFLVLSNLWTLSVMGGREEVGRRKETRKMEEREKWVQGIVTALWEELLANRGQLGGIAAGAVPPLAPRPPHGDLREEVGALATQLDLIEQRISDIRENLKQLDQLD
ncbi:GRAM-domain-containing protein [Dichomitus squalens]|nr:GRAM-domain-containing protein [Dichomitus squalens]